MKATVVDGNLSIDLGDLADSLSDEDARTLAKHLSTVRVVVESVVDQLIDGFAFSEEDPLFGWSTYSDTLQRLRAKLITSMPAVEARHTKELTEERDRAKNSAHYWECVADRLAGIDVGIHAMSGDLWSERINRLHAAQRHVEETAGITASGYEATR